MEYSAQRVRSKTRAAVQRREDEVEQEEIESGELNLIPYLDMVTNLMLFLLASVSAGLILVADRHHAARQGAAVDASVSPAAAANPDDQPLKLVVSITRDRMILWSIYAASKARSRAPKATFPRTGSDGEPCDGPYMCESNVCDADDAEVRARATHGRSRCSTTAR